MHDIKLPSPPDAFGNAILVEDRPARTLRKLIEIVQAMSPKERELSLVLLQSIAVWDSLDDKADGKPLKTTRGA